VADTDDALEYYSVNRAIKAIDEADVVFLLIDAQEGLSDQDKKIAQLACDRGRAVVLALNKWDTMPAIKNTFNAVCDRIRFMFGQMDYAPIVALSAKDGTGLEKLLNLAISMNAQLDRVIETSELNIMLQRWLEEYPPPVGPNTHFKIKYMVQASHKPQRFIIFVSRPQAIREPYLAYLRNKLRKDMHLDLIPLKIEVRASRTERHKASSR
jgi:GTP-binding protein